MNKRNIIYYIIVIAVLGIFVFPMSYDVYISFSSPTMNDIKLKCAKKNLGIIWELFDPDTNTFSRDFSQQIKSDFLEDSSLLVNKNNFNNNILAIYSWKSAGKRKKYYFVILLKSGEIIVK